jgi:heme a synthase
MKSGNKSLFAFAVFTGLCTLLLLGVGGMVTSRGAGMAVPDWPTSYGYNMFFFPLSYWVGGVFYEHSHRLVASFVGLLTVLLTRWLGGSASRKPLAIIGAAEVLAGIVLAVWSPDLKGTGYFLSGIGGVVLFAAALPFKGAPAQRPLPLLGWIVFWLVQFQGLLGGLRVVLFKDEIGVFHAMLAQVFFVLICAIALLSAPGWADARKRLLPDINLSRLVWIGTALIFLQLIVGAGMRHQHAGLAIPDFPLAYGKVWPDTSPEAVASYNSQRIEVTAAKPITALQIQLQMIHRVIAVVILGVVAAAAVRAVRQAGARSTSAKLCLVWLAMILGQGTLGAYTIWTNKAADIATAHLLGGALSLAFGAIVCILLFCSLAELGARCPARPEPADGPLGNPSMADGKA